jgi:hypothetical protein
VCVCIYTYIYEYIRLHIRVYTQSEIQSVQCMLLYYICIYEYVNFYTLFKRFDILNELFVMLLAIIDSGYELSESLCSNPYCHMITYENLIACV